MTKPSFSNQLVSFQPLLLNRALGYTQDQVAAHDLVQDTLLRALSYQDYYREGTNLKAWLLTIMRNLFLNNYRRRKSRETDSVDWNTLEYLYTETADNKDPTHLQLEEVDQLINRLDNPSQVVLRLLGKGFIYREIAELLDEPLGTIKSRIFHARKRLNQLRLRVA